MAFLAINFYLLTKLKINRFVFLFQVILMFFYLIFITYFHSNKSFKFLFEAINKIFKFNLRNYLINYVNRIHNKQIANYILLLLFNFKTSESLNFYQNLTKLSIVHLIVVGGLHVNLLCLIFKKIFYKFPNISNFFSFIIAFFICYLNNFSPATTRTFLAYFLCLFKFTRKKSTNISIILITLIAPFALTNIGLCMSYVSTRALKFFKIKRKNFISDLLISFLVLLYLIPFLAKISGYISLWSIFLSFLFSSIFILIYALLLIFSWTAFFENYLKFVFEHLKIFIEKFNNIDISIPIFFIKNDLIVVFYYLVLEVLINFLLLKSKEEIWKNNLKKYY